VLDAEATPLEDAEVVAAAVEAPAKPAPPVTPPGVAPVVRLFGNRYDDDPPERRGICRDRPRGGWRPMR
jgi:hypothetical protein